MLWFRVFLEFLNKMIEKYDEYLKTNKFEIAVAKSLVYYFDTNLIESPEGLFYLILNKENQEKAENIIKKVKKFVDDYIKGKIHVLVNE